MPVEQLLGPVAALAGALVVVGFLARILLDYIADLKTARDLWRDRSLASDVRVDRLADAFELALRVRPPT